MKISQEQHLVCSILSLIIDSKCILSIRILIIMWIFLFQSVGQHVIIECVNSELNLLKRDKMMDVYSRASVEVLTFHTPDCFSFFV